MLRWVRSKLCHTPVSAGQNGEQASTSDSILWSNELLFNYHVAITLLKVSGNWLSRIEKMGQVRIVPDGQLQDVIMMSKEWMIGQFPITLAHAVYRSALLGVDVRVRTDFGQELSSEEILLIIDAKATTWGLDFSGCDIRGLDLGPNWIKERFEIDPDVGSRVGPLWRSDVTGGLSLSGARLSKCSLARLRLDQADIQSTSFSDAMLDDIDFSEANAGRAKFDGASLTRIKFCRADLLGASLTEAKILNCDFQDSLLANTDWRGAMVIGGTFERARLTNARLEGIDFSGIEAGGLSGVYWSNAHLDRTRIRRDQLGEKLAQEVEADSGKRVWSTRDEPKGEFRLPPPMRAEAYRIARDEYAILKNNFVSIGRYADSSWAYYKERTMDRKRLIRAFLMEPLGRPRNLWSWIVNWIEFSLTGYGERPWRVAWASFFAIAAFALMYQHWDMLEFSSACKEGWECHEIVGYLLYSGSAFVAVGSSVARVSSRLGEVVTILEAGMGIALFALLLFTLGNRISRS